MILNTGTARRDRQVRGRRSAGAVPVFLGALCLLALAGLVGAAAPARAATAFQITLSPLIGTPGVNEEIPQVTYGGKIGYHVFVKNTGDSNTQHASIVVKSADDPLTLVDERATFFDSDNGACVKDPKNDYQAICTPAGGTLAPLDTFDANLRFTAPSTGPADGLIVSSTAEITVSAQTVGGKNTKGTTLQKSDPPTLTQVVAAGSKNDTYLRSGERAETTGFTTVDKQNLRVDLPTLPPGLFGLALSIHDEPGAICGTCLPYHTELTIPVASSVELPGNPFVDGTTFNPYGWRVDARYDSSLKVLGVFHLGDDNILDPVPACADVGGAPSTANPFCWDSFLPKQNAPANQKLATAIGRALENGKIGFG